MSLAAIEKAIRALARCDIAARVAAYNEATRLLRDVLLHDLPPDPCLAPQLWPTEGVKANDYNPNKVASPELDLLEQSMRADGITMPVVVCRAGSTAEVVDGFHRRTVGAERLGRAFIPCSEIDSARVDRMASTVRHNRARGKHQVELMGELVKGMLALGWDDTKIGVAMGMSEEEMLRLRQMVGAAKSLAAHEYTRAWQGRDGQDHPDE